MIQLNRDFKEFLIALNDHSVEYLLVGGYAVAYHGYVRATKDMDIWVAPTPENAMRVVAALHAFGFTDPTIAPDWFTDPESIFGMGNHPYRIEIFSAIPGVVFAECYAHRVMDTIDGIPFPVINLNDLKQNKRAVGRPQDLADLANLP